jgi:hypothetical protein
MKHNKVYLSLLLILFVSGSVQAWTRSAGDVDTDICQGVCFDEDSCVYVTGSFNTTLNIESLVFPSAGGKDIYVAKYLPDGTLVWAVTFGGGGDDSGQDLVWNSTVEHDQLFVTGYFSDVIVFDGIYVSAGWADIFLLCLDPATGGVNWAETAGGNSPDHGFGVAVDRMNGNPVITGDFTATALFGGGAVVLNSTGVGDRELFVATYLESGFLVWATSDGSDLDDVGRSVVVKNHRPCVTGFIGAPAIFGGFTLPFAGNRDVVVAKYLPGGSVLWARSDGGPGEDTGMGITVSNSGRLHVTGFFEETAEWSDTTGSTTLVSAGAKDIFLLELRGFNGYMRRVQSAGGPDDDIGTDVATTGPFVFTTGFINGTAVFPGYGPTAPGAGGRDIFLARSRIMDGVFTHVLVDGDVGDDSGRSIATIDFCFAVGGYFHGPATLYGEAPPHWNVEDAFVAMLCPFGPPTGPQTNINYDPDTDSATISWIHYPHNEIVAYRIYMMEIYPYPEENYDFLLEIVYEEEEPPIELPIEHTIYDIQNYESMFFFVRSVY